MKFYRCKHCGNIIAFAHSSGVKVMCCGEPMAEIVANSTDAANEKHVPVVNVNGNIVTVSVGEVTHPMTSEHHIAWVAIETKQGNQRKVLAVDGTPETHFALMDGDEVLRVYAYCNLHDLWVKEM